MEICLKITKMARPHRRPMSKLPDCCDQQGDGEALSGGGEVFNGHGEELIVEKH